MHTYSKQLYMYIYMYIHASPCTTYVAFISRSLLSFTHSLFSYSLSLSLSLTLSLLFPPSLSHTHTVCIIITKPLTYESIAVLVKHFFVLALRWLAHQRVLHGPRESGGVATVVLETLGDVCSLDL